MKKISVRFGKLTFCSAESLGFPLWLYLPIHFIPTTHCQCLRICELKLFGLLHEELSPKCPLVARVGKDKMEDGEKVRG